MNNYIIKLAKKIMRIKLAILHENFQTHVHVVKKIMSKYIIIIYTVSIHCAPEMSEIDCIGRIESFWHKFVRGW